MSKNPLKDNTNKSITKNSKLMIKGPLHAGNRTPNSSIASVCFRLISYNNLLYFRSITIAQAIVNPNGETENLGITKYWHLPINLMIRLTEPYDLQMENHIKELENTMFIAFFSWVITNPNTSVIVDSLSASGKLLLSKLIERDVNLRNLKFYSKWFNPESQMKRQSNIFRYGYEIFTKDTKVIFIGRYINKYRIYLYDSESVLDDSTLDLLPCFTGLREKNLYMIKQWSERVLSHDPYRLLGFDENKLKQFDEDIAINILSLYLNFRKKAAALTNPDLVMTMGRLSWDTWKIQYSKMKAEEYKVPHWAIAPLQKAYTGGIMLHKSRFLRRAFHYDINSLYPFIMANKELPGQIKASCLEGPIQFDWQKDNLKGFFGFVRALVYVNPSSQIKVLINQQENLNNKNKLATGWFVGWYFTPELNHAQNHGALIYCLEGIEYDVLDPNTHNLKAFVDYFFPMRKTASTAWDRKVIKKILNYMSGKLGRVNNPSYTIIDTIANPKIKNGVSLDFTYKADYEAINKNKIGLVKCSQVGNLREEEPQSNNFPLQIAAAITSYGRIRLTTFMSLAIRSTRKTEIVYADTDSLFTTEPLELNRNFDKWINNELGGLKNEGKTFGIEGLNKDVKDKDGKVSGIKGIEKDYGQIFDLTILGPKQYGYCNKSMDSSANINRIDSGYKEKVVLALPIAKDKKVPKEILDQAYNRETFEDPVHITTETIQWDEDVLRYRVTTNPKYELKKIYSLNKIAEEEYLDLETKFVNHLKNIAKTLSE